MTSFDKQIDSQFEGYCWVGSDLVIGSAGAEAYKRQTTSSITPGNDGCYVVAEVTSDRCTIGTDSRGLRRLFLFQRGTIWAVGSSFAGLVDHLRHRGVELKPSPAILSAYAVQRGFNNQLAGAQTPIEDITLVPSFATLVIEHGVATLEYSSEQAIGDYETALSTYLSRWKGRLATLLTDDRVRIQADLSGGIDSRMVAAFLLSDPQFDPNDDRFDVVSARGKTRDFEVATQIASHYRISLKGQRDRDRSNISQAASLRSWNADSLGVYLPAYFHGGRFDLTQVHLHGAGGGNFRPYYSGDDLERQIRHSRKVLTDAHYEEWRANVLETSALHQAHRASVNSLILHYREFRNRFHFGHRPHHNIVFAPLESILTDCITDRLDGRDGRQIYFDSMESLAPGLMHFPFDKTTKAPSEENIRHLTLVETEETPIGAIFGEPSTEVEQSDIDDAYMEWVADSEEAFAREEVLSFVGEKCAASARFVLDQVSAKRKVFPAHDRGIIDLSFVRSVDFVMR
ncbi:hypothetical protein [Brevibacterium aurantiacum]|uniref:hypothetical protein n=1 Tax=Brevibacterium aurantiacum TaxID=273384 RepID=UPI000FCB3A37|nr:hypothetical protein [Brevibacterium aurantiacum]